MPTDAPIEAVEPSQRDAVALSGWNFRGVVTGEARKPLTRFGVTATRLGTVGEVVEQLEQPLAEHPEGEFEFTDLTPGHWRIAPFAPELRLVLERNFWERDDTRWSYQLLPASFWKEPPKPAKVSGVVLLPSGEPAPAAEIRATSTTTATPVFLRRHRGTNVRSGVDGKFELSLEPGARTLIATLAGCNDSAPVDVVLEEGSSLAGIRLKLGAPRLARVWVAPADPSRPREFTLRWAELSGEHEGSFKAFEGEDHEFALTGTGEFRWELRCEPDPRLSGIFQAPTGDPSPSLRLERLPIEPVLLTFPNGSFDSGVAIAADPAMGALPVVFGKASGKATEFELPRAGLWRFDYNSDGFQTSFDYVVQVPSVPRFEDPGPRLPESVFEALGY